MGDPLLKVVDLKKYFPVKGIFFTKGYVKAVDGVSFEIERGKTMGLVGESGCGKTTVGRLVLRLLKPTSGKVFFEGKDIFKLKGKELREFRKKAQMVFQDPYSSLNPRMTVFDIIYEPVKVYKLKVSDPEKFVVNLLYQVGLNESHLYRYPHEFSGGQRQRIAIARILALNPEFIVLDEPTSALDVSVQAQILNLLKELQRKYNLTYLFISHDLGVVRYMSDWIAVMYLGQIVEYGPAEEVFEKPLHPYTKALFSAIPIPDPEITRKREKLKVPGEPPSPINPPPGCRFHPRCPFKMDICEKTEPELIEYEKDHFVKCYLYSRK
ncbi:oligopeptide/dipeptide ABC transporter, ATPase subunit [Staphylothermus marinus F1]|uniref:Oligopeptide/dipeptide ABC transporter, ATPase subunit n=1 Tax=Staphylothermus marinus (strain ATCC 43588 / DSM 3639 / JCM 9404 / F1) TaxID=399550 RepID=A3DLE4_STAMF|nr:ABC transporter ATP-binding protein [Staphylothermus marinus]ABN69454.1 oligopeptide/dipeptide ABC transporter, ATPase subunit [Staphylothermus marinus F1]